MTIVSKITFYTHNLTRAQYVITGCMKNRKHIFCTREHIPRNTALTYLLIYSWFYLFERHIMNICFKAQDINCFSS